MFANITNEINGKRCSCGKVHSFDGTVSIGAGAISALPGHIRDLGGSKVFILTDENTFKAAGQQVCDLLKGVGIPFTSYTFSHSPVEPDEYSVGNAVMHFDSSCDMVIGVGSGVINDIGKILSAISKTPYIIVATAPSMDGYASASSSMTRDGLKISLPTRSADVIIGDTDILCQAPLHMMKSGLGDMLAKYVSICEWRIANLVTGEYYCEEIAQLIRDAVKKCVDNADKLLDRDPAAVEAVFEGLVLGGIAMNYAGLSRPASGVEHYISHIIDMRGLEFHTPVELHGIQCAVGTLLAIELYEKLSVIKPDYEKAIRYAEGFDYTAWAETLKAFLGKGAQSMIALESKEGKYNTTAHKARLEIILSRWDEILEIIRQELPASLALKNRLIALQMPTALDDMRISQGDFPTIFQATKDIRDKYVLSRLMWDLGIIEDTIH